MPGVGEDTHVNRVEILDDVHGRAGVKPHELAGVVVDDGLDACCGRQLLESLDEAADFIQVGPVVFVGGPVPVAELDVSHARLPARCEVGFGIVDVGTVEVTGGGHEWNGEALIGKTTGRIGECDRDIRRVHGVSVPDA